MPTWRRSSAGIERTNKMLKSGDKRLLRELELLETVRAALEAGRPARHRPRAEEDAAFFRSLFLLTAKPVIYVANVDEAALGAAPDAALARLYVDAAAEGAEALTGARSLRRRSPALDPAEKAAFLAEMGVQESGLDQLVRACYRLLGLISFLTAGADEVRAWTIRRGWKAPQAAGVIHTDFERGFNPRRDRPLRYALRPRLHGRLPRKGPRPLRGQGLRHAGRRRRPLPL